MTDLAIPIRHTTRGHMNSASPLPRRFSKWTRIRAIAVHEYRAASRSRILVTLLALLVVVTITSVYVASVTHRSQVAEYQACKAAAQASGLQKIAPSPLAPMSLLRGGLEYLQIIGSVIGLTLGFLTISRERASKTLSLLRSRPVTAGELATGQLLGAVELIATLISATAVTAVLCIGTIGNDWISPGETLQLLLAYGVSVAYVTGFYALGAWASARANNPINGLFAALVFWLVVVLVFPQIGDTLDSDNQIPGGLFKALGLNRADETTVLAHFTLFETIRTRTEYVSFAQHYQRFVFAMADVKESYRPLSLAGLFGKVWTDLAWALAWPAAFIALQRRSIRQLSNNPTRN